MLETPLHTRSMLNNELPRFVAYLKEHGSQVLFNSNGILLDLKRGDALVTVGPGEGLKWSL